MLDSDRTSIHRAAIAIALVVGVAACQPAMPIGLDDTAKADLVAVLAAKGVARDDAMRYASAIRPGVAADGYYLPAAVGGSVQEAAVVLEQLDDDGCRQIQYQVEARGRPIVYDGVVCRPPGIASGTLAWNQQGALKNIRVVAAKPDAKAAAKAATLAAATKKAAPTAASPSPAPAATERPSPAKAKADL